MLDLEHIRNEVSAIAKHNGALKAILFGSYARGTATEHSDVDLIVIEATDRPFLARADKYFDPLADRLAAAIETLVYTPEEFQRMAERGFIKQALREGIVLYESGEI